MAETRPLGAANNRRTSQLANANHTEALEGITSRRKIRLGSRAVSISMGLREEIP